MASEQLVSYIIEQLAQGFSPQEIKNTLLQSGWDRINVEGALREAERGAAGEGVAALAQTLQPHAPLKRVLKRTAILGIFILIAAGIAALLFFFRGPQLLQ